MTPRETKDNRGRRFPNLPERIQGLERIAGNLWWSWHRQAREMFRALDLDAWRESEENPVRMLALLPNEALAAAIAEVRFLELYNAVLDRFERTVTTRAGFTHLVAGAKSRRVVGMRIEQRARDQDLPFYRRCERLLARSVGAVPQC